MQLGDIPCWDLMSCYLQLRTCHSPGPGLEAQGGEDGGSPTPVPSPLLPGPVGCPHPTPQFCFIHASVPALTESSLEEELNRVCGGMLVMPDLLFGVFFGGAPVLGGRRAPANWVLTVASLRGCSCWGVVPSMSVTERQLGQGVPTMAVTPSLSLSPSSSSALQGALEFL